VAEHVLSVGDRCAERAVPWPKQWQITWLPTRFTPERFWMRRYIMRPSQ